MRPSAMKHVGDLLRVELVRPGHVSGSPSAAGSSRLWPPIGIQAASDEGDIGRRVEQRHLPHRIAQEHLG